jgi:two-component system chemotaxis response regulator CheY
MKSCLIVDDSKVVRMVARKILEGLRFDIDEAEDGQKAIEACQRHMPDAVLLDWNMPVKNGLEHIKRAMEAGANEYIMKPFDSDIIESKFVQVGLI